MEQLIQEVVKRTGMPADQVRTVATHVVEFIKGKLPGPIASQIDGFLSGGGESGGGGLGDLGSKLGGMFGT